MRRIVLVLSAILTISAVLVGYDRTQTVDTTSLVSADTGDLADARQSWTPSAQQASLREMSAGQRQAQGFLEGAFTAELVYTPVAPCRVFDSRFSNGGRLIAGTDRSFYVATSSTDFDLSFQGGSASGCGVPYGYASAVMLNLTAVGPDGTGYLRAWPAGTSAPNATVLNYSPALNASNAVNLPMCDPYTDSTECGSGDVTVRAFVSNVDVVGDVVGYFAPSLPPQLVKSEVEALSASPATVVGTTCTKAAGGSITHTPPWAGDIVIDGDVTLSIDHTEATADTIRLFVGYGVSNGTTSVTNGCAETGSACTMSSVAHIAAGDPSSTDQLITVPVRCTIPVTFEDPSYVGDSFTINLWARQDSGAGSDVIDQYRLTATFTPDDVSALE